MKKITLTIVAFAALFTAQAQENLTIYANMSLSDAIAIESKYPNEIKILATSDTDAAVHMSEDVDHLLHEVRTTHGPGYIYCSTAEEAILDITTPRISRIEQASYSITEGETVRKALAVINENNIYNQILELEAYGSRYHDRPGANKSANDLKAKWEAMAASYNREDVSVRLVTHNNTRMYSVIMTIAGDPDGSPNEVVVIGGHLDSTNSDNNNIAPGSDDDASGISVITEAARTLFEIGFVPNRTIEIMAYAAEEVGLRGSKEIAIDYKKRNVNVIAVGQFDMANFKTSPRDVYFVNDRRWTDSNLTSFFKELLDTYHGPSSGDEITYGNTTCGYACSDHASWADQGYRAVMPFESSFADFQAKNWTYHSANDKMSNMPGRNASHAFKFAKLSVEYLVEVSKTARILSTPDFEREGYEIYVVDRTLNFKSNDSRSAIKEFAMYDITGKLVLTKSDLGNTGSFSLNTYSAGNYVISVTLENTRKLSKKVVLK